MENNVDEKIKYLIGKMNNLNGIEDVQEINKILQEGITIDKILEEISTKQYDEYIEHKGAAEGAIDAANILKPLLARGDIQLIGATTIEEYRKYIEKDSALERRFQPVTVVEPSINDTVDVLKGIKSYYEVYHRINISDNLVRKMVILSERYITDRFLPDKAIDLLDESAAYASLRNVAMEKYDAVAENLNKLKAQETKITSAADPDSIDYEKLAEVRSEIAKVNEDLKKLSKKAFGVNVTEDDVAYVIELWTGIPSSKIKEDELAKLSKIEDKLKSKIIGQDEAVEAVASAIKRSRVQISPRRRPASFIFVGPTGVGKTELVKVLSKELFDSPETFIRLDMSEFMEKHSVSRIIGSPPGYVGYDDSGQVTEKVRRRPYSVLLFDEIEKAHKDVFNILLQILDDGRITDSQGRTVDFKNTIIIMTSNLGSEFILENVPDKDKLVMDELKRTFKPEFINRIDEIIMFKSLDKKTVYEILDKIISDIEKRLDDKKIKLNLTSAAKDYIINNSFDEKYGARPIKRFVSRNLETLLATEIINDNIKFGETVNIDVKDDHLIIK